MPLRDYQQDAVPELRAAVARSGSVVLRAAHRWQARPSSPAR